MTTTATTPLRTFEDWGECDDQIRAGFPGNSLPADTQLTNTTGETAQPRRYTHEYIPVCLCARCKPESEKRDAMARLTAACVIAAKRAMFEQACHQVRVIELRPIQEKARAKTAARYAELEQQRAIVRAAGAGFSLLK